MAVTLNYPKKTDPSDSAGDGTAVVLSDCAGFSAKRTGAVAKKRYSPDLGNGGVFDV